MTISKYESYRNNLLWKTGIYIPSWNMQKFVDFWFIIVQSMENVFTENKLNSWILVLI